MASVGVSGLRELPKSVSRRSHRFCPLPFGPVGESRAESHQEKPPRLGGIWYCGCPLFEDELPLRKSQPQAHSASRGPGRRNVPETMPEMRRVHEGLPYQWPPAYPNGGRLGGNLVSHPNPQVGILPVLLHPLWPGLPFRGNKKAHGERKGSSKDRPGLHRQKSLYALFPGDGLHRL